MATLYLLPVSFHYVHQKVKVIYFVSHPIGRSGVYSAVLWYSHISHALSPPRVSARTHASNRQPATRRFTSYVSSDATEIIVKNKKKEHFFGGGNTPHPSRPAEQEDAPDSFPTRAPSGFLQSADRDFRQHPRGRIMHVSAHSSEVFKLCRVIFRSTAYLQFDMWRLLAATYAPASFWDQWIR